MKPCPECSSDSVYRYKENVDSGGAYGPDLLPKLSTGWLSFAKLLPVVCADCGYIRLYADKESRRNLEASEDWTKL